MQIYLKLDNVAIVMTSVSIMEKVNVNLIS